MCTSSTSTSHHCVATPALSGQEFSSPTLKDGEPKVHQSGNIWSDGSSCRHGSPARIHSSNAEPAHRCSARKCLAASRQ